MLKSPGLPAFHQFHNNVAGIVLGPGIENIDDVRVFEHTGRMRLVEKHLAVTGTDFLVFQGLGQRHLDGHRRIRKGIVALVDHAHTALAHQFNDLVFTEFFRDLFHHDSIMGLVII